MYIEFSTVKRMVSSRCENIKNGCVFTVAANRYTTRPILIVIILAIIIIGFADGSKLYVPEGYQKIQDAIDAAKDGDEVLVLQKEYNECIAINKSIRLTGILAVSGIPVIIPNAGKNAIAMLSDGITLKGFKVRNERGNASTCIYINSNNNSIQDMVLKGSSGKDNGIILKECINNHIVNCTLAEMGQAGIDIQASSANVVLNNTLSFCQYGIYLSDAAENQVISNTFSSNIYGIIYKSFIEEAENNITENAFKDTVYREAIISNIGQL